MRHSARIELPDGRQLDYEIRPSAKAKNLRLKISAREELIVVAPNGLSKRKVIELVTGKRDWIAARLKEFDTVRHLLEEDTTSCPEAFDLPALAESWRVEYKETKSKNVGTKTGKEGLLLVYGAIKDSERCKASLRRWLARRAKETFDPWLTALSAETGLKFSSIKIKSQRTRWGSCSTNGVINLNCKLLFLPRNLVRYVLIHELCHTIEMNHGAKFWTMVKKFEPLTDISHGAMRYSWKFVPGWAIRPIGKIIA